MHLPVELVERPRREVSNILLLTKLRLSSLECVDANHDLVHSINDDILSSSAVYESQLRTESRPFVFTFVAIKFLEK